MSRRWAHQLPRPLLRLQPARANSVDIVHLAHRHQFDGCTEHPGNGPYRQSLAGLEKINSERDIPSDQRTCNAAGTLAAAACQSGFKQIVHVALNDSGNKLIAAQGTPGTTQSKLIDISTQQALGRPLKDSSKAHLAAMNKAARPRVAPVTSNPADAAASHAGLNDRLIPRQITFAPVRRSQIAINFIAS